jgi:transmembrane sensor
MARITESERDEAGRAAAGWLIALQEDPDDPDVRRGFEAWRTASPLHAELWRQVAGTYAALGALPRKAAGRPRRRMVAGLAGLAAAAALALVALPGLILDLQADIATGTAEMRNVRLADGSMLRLGPESTVSVAMGEERRVRLIRGRAFFEVNPDPERPFRVEAGQVRVTVVGTAFEVRHDEHGADVTVREGRVLVEPESGMAASERLEAGGWVHVDRAGVRRGSLPPEQVAAWMEGRIIANDRPLGVILDELRPYISSRIVLADQTLATRPLTGVYNLADPNGALEAIAAGLGVSVRHLSPWILLVSAG